MGPMRILLRISFLAGTVAILSGIAYSDTNATEIRPILVPEGTTSVRIDRKALDQKVSSLLAVIPGSLSYTHMPERFPVGNPLGIRGEVQVEGRDDRTTHMALLVKRGQVVKEMFYFTVRMKPKVRNPGPNTGQSTRRAAESVGGGDTVRRYGPDSGSGERICDFLVRYCAGKRANRGQDCRFQPDVRCPPPGNGCRTGPGSNPSERVGSCPGLGERFSFC